MEDDLEVLMWATLERCGRTSEGYRLDPHHPLIALLIKENMLRRRKAGFMVLTDKGRAILKLRPKGRAKRPVRSSRRPRGSSPLAQPANE
jgi:hypothetical protein